jgi:hypothetical protein
MRHDKQNPNTRHSRIHMARRLKNTLTDLYVDGKVADYLAIVRKYNQLVKTL